MFLSKIQLQSNTDDIILWLLKNMCVCVCVYIGITYNKHRVTVGINGVNYDIHVCVFSLFKQSSTYSALM